MCFKKKEENVELTEEEKKAKKEEKKRKRKENHSSFISEFKKFINRGNIVDLAVGVIIGAAFNEVVKALTDRIFKPLINGAIYEIAKLCGSSETDPLKAIYTILVPVYKEVDGEKILDMTASIYIDWGAFISSIINFLLTALILFFLVKFINRFGAKAKETTILIKNGTEEKILELRQKHENKGTKQIEIVNTPEEKKDTQENKDTKEEK